MLVQPLQDFGYLVVKPFDELYAEFAAKPEFTDHRGSLLRGGAA